VPGDIIAHALQKAAGSSPAIRAAARIRIARVQSVTDPGRARITFEMGLEEILGPPGGGRRSFLGQAQEVAAAVAPDLLRDIPSDGVVNKKFQSGKLIDIMLKHGHIDAAFDYAVRYDDPFNFPFGYTGNLMHKLDDQARRLILFRRIVDVWRASQNSALMTDRNIPMESGLHSGHIRAHHLHLDFVLQFGWWWKILPSDEALTVVHEVVHAAMEQPDLGTRAGFGEEIRFTSSREHVLFEVLHILRHLDPLLAESLIAGHEQLAVAARRYPDGQETIRQEFEERRMDKESSGAACGVGFGMAGDQRDFAYHMALRRSSESGDFGPAIEHALERYLEDTAYDSPNQAPKSLWPSTCAFRSILYSAGKRSGRKAGTLLDHIPDEDLGLFAEIELAAALAGLPEFPETKSTWRPLPPMQGTPMRAPDGSPIRCPKCRWVPVREARWSCKCGHRWNTFDTRGICPSCQYQWEITLCPGCHGSSLHADWYLLG
jgi:hypothetical protein